MTPDFRDDMQDLESAEDFLGYFELPFDERVVRVNRLHILQRFHDYLAAEDDPGYDRHKALLARAYQDFVESDARTEKVFKVFRDATSSGDAPVGFVPLGDIAK